MAYSCPLGLSPAALVLSVKGRHIPCADDGAAGNAIDFFVKIRGGSFNEAMQIILAPRSAGTETPDYDPSERKIREEPGNVAKTAR